METCAFCRRDIPRQALWESKHYQVLADEYPRCAGHVLLVTRDHLRSQMHAPTGWMPEFQDAQERVRQFLQQTFGSAAFYENGAAKQEVPHAHLHGLPFHPVVPREWLEAGDLRRITSWQDARKECERAGYYFYLETQAGAFLVARKRYKRVLRGIRDQLIGQTEAALDPSTAKMARGGSEMVARTAELWHAWERGSGHPPGS